MWCAASAKRSVCVAVRTVVEIALPDVLNCLGATKCCSSCSAHLLPQCTLAFDTSTLAAKFTKWDCMPRPAVAFFKVRLQALPSLSLLQGLCTDVPLHTHSVGLTVPISPCRMVVSGNWCTPAWWAQMAKRMHTEHFAGLPKSGLPSDAVQPPRLEDLKTLQQMNACLR